MISISLSNNRGELELRAAVTDFSKEEIMFQLFASGIKFCETPYYEDARAVLQDVFELNQPKEGAN